MWGAVYDLVNLACVTCRLRAGEWRESAGHLPSGHAVGSGLSHCGEAWGVATPDQFLLQGAPPHATRGPPSGVDGGVITAPQL